MSATPELVEDPVARRHVYRVGWRQYLDNPTPTERLRARGHGVQVAGPDALMGGVETHWLEPTSFGLPEPWDSVWVALGPSPQNGLLFSHGPVPATSNGAGLFYVPPEVAKMAEGLEVSTEIPADSREGFDASLDACLAAPPVTLAECQAFLDPFAPSPDYAENFVRIGDAFVNARFVAAAMHLGGTVAHPSGPSGPVLVPGVGVFMPMRVSERLREM